MYKKYASKADYKNYALVSLVFLGSMALALWLTFYVAQRQLNVQLTHQARPIYSAVENLLEETRSVAREAEEWVGKPCNRPLESNLNALPTREMGMLVINLLKGDRISCSSLLANRGEWVDISAFSTQGVKIDDSVVSAGIPVFSLYHRVGNGGIVVSADLRYLWGIMGNSNRDENFALLVNNHLLTRGGILKGAEALRGAEEYPQRQEGDLFTLAWRAPDTLVVWHEILGSWFYLLVIIAPPLLLTALVWSLLTRRRSLYQYLENAVHDDHIIPYYQPIICAHSNRVIGAEILARWDHPNIGFVPPDIFIPVAEKTKTIGLMTENLLKRVLADCQRPDSRLPERFTFNVNISHSHLVADDFCAFTSEFAARFKRLGLRLAFEFTENKQIDFSGDILNKIKVVRDNGVAISLDDFGTGFSNLSWISSLNPDSIKIDRMFINQISQDASTPLINCVIDMAKQMGIKTVAEGVEYDYQATWLQQNDIDYFQGYLYSKPLTFSAFIDYFRHDVLTQHLRMPKDTSLQH